MLKALFGRSRTKVHSETTAKKLVGNKGSKPSLDRRPLAEVPLIKPALKKTTKKTWKDGVSQRIESVLSTKRLLGFIPPCPMLLMDGTLPLLAIVQIVHLFDVMVSIMFVLVYIVLNTYYWFVFIPMPIVEFSLSVYILWEIFILSTYNMLAGKLLLNFLSIAQASLFQGFHERLIDPKYYGYQIGAYFLLMKVFFTLLTFFL